MGEELTAFLTQTNPNRTLFDFATIDSITTHLSPLGSKINFRPYKIWFDFYNFLVLSH